MRQGKNLLQTVDIVDINVNPTDSAIFFPFKFQRATFPEEIQTDPFALLKVYN